MKGSGTLLGIALLLATACSSQGNLDKARRGGRAQAENDFQAGRIEMPMGGGTTRPGPHGSGQEELEMRAWAEGYRARIRELQGQ